MKARLKGKAPLVKLPKGKGKEKGPKRKRGRPAVHTVTTSQGKTIATEKVLQIHQSKLFGFVKRLKGRPRDEKILFGLEKTARTMFNIMKPYGDSIFKRSFKHRATLEEMNRVVYEAINSLIFDIWFKGRRVHSSFGAMMKFKMLHFLDGKINLFDTRTTTYSVESIDALKHRFENSGDENGIDLVEYCSDTLRNYQGGFEKDFSPIYTQSNINTIKEVILKTPEIYNRFAGNKKRAAILIKTIFGFNRYLQGRHNHLLFQGDGPSRFYYVKTLDFLFQFLKHEKEGQSDDRTTYQPI